MEPRGIQNPVRPPLQGLNSRSVLAVYSQFSHVPKRRNVLYRLRVVRMSNTKQGTRTSGGKKETTEKGKFWTDHNKQVKIMGQRGVKKYVAGRRGESLPRRGFRPRRSMKEPKNAKRKNPRIALGPRYAVRNMCPLPEAKNCRILDTIV